MGNHVYYARYMNFLEEARGEFFRAIGHPLLRLQDEDLIFPVIECHIAYKAPARYDDVLTIEICLSRLERVRLQFEYSVRNQSNTKIVRASTTHVCTSAHEKPKRIPTELISALEPYVRAKEAK